MNDNPPASLPVPLPGLPHGQPAAMRVIRPQRCEKCKYAIRAPDPGIMECHFGPPSATGILMGMQNTPNGPQPAIMEYTMFPKVKMDEFCGQWAPGLGVATQ